jgi:hypothetical protein
MLANATEAEDLTQDVFLALCNENRYDPARGSLAAYLVTMTRSRAIAASGCGGAAASPSRPWPRTSALWG